MENGGKKAVAESSAGHIPSDSSSPASITLSPVRITDRKFKQSPEEKVTVPESSIAHISTDSSSSSLSSSPSHGPSPDRNGKPSSPSQRSPGQSSLCSELSDHSSLSHVSSLRDDLTQLSPLGNVPAEPITPPPQPRPVVNRSIWEESRPVRKVDPIPGDGVSDGRRARQTQSILRRAKRGTDVKKVALGFRVCGLVFCLVSFAVMASDKSEGWALDSFYRYKEFRYCISVNVISFVYSAAQVFDLIYQLSTDKHLFHSNQVRHYFDFSMDQILTYLLMSASSSAATRVDDWQSNWGKDKFPEMATGSVATSFLGFVALACSALISGYTLFTSRSI